MALSFGLLTLVVVIIGVSGFVSSRQAGDAVDEIVNNSLPSIEAILLVSGEIQGVVSNQNASSTP